MKYIISNYVLTVAFLKLKYIVTHLKRNTTITFETFSTIVMIFSGKEKRIMASNEPHGNTNENYASKTIRTSQVCGRHRQGAEDVILLQRVVISANTIFYGRFSRALCNISLRKKK